MRSNTKRIRGGGVILKGTSSNTSRVLFVGQFFFLSQWKGGPLRQLSYEISSVYGTIVYRRAHFSHSPFTNPQMQSKNLCSSLVKRQCNKHKPHRSGTDL